MDVNSQQFHLNSEKALNDTPLQQALSRAKYGFVDKRKIAVEAFDGFEELKTSVRQVRDFTQQHLDIYLEQYEKNLVNNGGHCHYASTPEQANQIIVDICKQQNASKIAKGKSMVGEEIALNDALESNNFDVVETDLGEYIIQLANEPPSHIIAPAIHKTRQQITELFAQFHHQNKLEETPTSIEDIVAEARDVLRQQFLSADVGITGANFLIAESGSSVLITNEGNGDLTSCLPKTHIIVTSIDKVLPTFADAHAAVRLLTRSATGQSISNYFTLHSGPKADDDCDGPESFHVVLVDNGRSDLLKTDFKEVLRCIRCGACMNHCPVYSSVGGHAYGWVYPGPIGSVLTPLIKGLDQAAILPNACTMCGRCAEVCPAEIRLPKLLRDLRNQEYKKKITKPSQRFGIKVWSYLASRSKLYHLFTGIVCYVSKLFNKKSISRFPFLSAWLKHRDLSIPQQASFLQQYKNAKKRESK